MNFTGRSVGLKLIPDYTSPATPHAFSKKITTRKPHRANLETTAPLMRLRAWTATRRGKQALLDVTLAVSQYHLSTTAGGRLY